MSGSYYLTADVLRILGTTETRLRAAFASGKLAKPQLRDGGHRLLWSEAELQAARLALATDLRRKKQPAG